MLSKYHAVLLPLGAGFYLLIRPTARRCLRQPGPYLAAVVGLAVFAPVIVWNAGHGWASFVYQGTRAGGFHGLQPAMLIEALVGQILYLTPWIWVRLVVVLFGLVRRGPGDWSAAEAFLICQAVPVLALFLGVSTFQPDHAALAADRLRGPDAAAGPALGGAPGCQSRAESVSGLPP